MKYFVLKPAGTTLHALACREAMRTYADFIEEEIPELAEDLREWADYEELYNQNEQRLASIGEL